MKSQHIHVVKHHEYCIKKLFQQFNVALAHSLHETPHILQSLHLFFEPKKLWIRKPKDVTI